MTVMLVTWEAPDLPSISEDLWVSGFCRATNSSSFQMESAAAPNAKPLCFPWCCTVTRETFLVRWPMNFSTWSQEILPPTEARGLLQNLHMVAVFLQTVANVLCKIQRLDQTGCLRASWAICRHEGRHLWNAFGKIIIGQRMPHSWAQCWLQKEFKHEIHLFHAPPTWTTWRLDLSAHLSCEHHISVSSCLVSPYASRDVQWWWPPHWEPLCIAAHRCAGLCRKVFRGKPALLAVSVHVGDS